MYIWKDFFLGVDNLWFFMYFRKEVWIIGFFGFLWLFVEKNDFFFLIEFDVDKNVWLLNLFWELIGECGSEW